MRILALKNPVQEYSWGSKTFIPELLGEPSPSIRPQAEIWMGAHPKAPSLVSWNNDWISLPELIRQYPEGILGESVARRFSNALPFLFKVLAAAGPTSVQAHPGKERAREGFEKEDRLRVPLDAPHRNFRDSHHKPEILCALTPFKALKGFRRPEEIISLMERLGVSVLGEYLGPVQRKPDTSGLRAFFTALMTLEKGRQSVLVNKVAALAEAHVAEAPCFEWVTRLGAEFPGDIGCLSPLLLNLIELQPQEAIFVPPGELHAYLEGAGMELMTGSDNVLRGGLTAKHIDVPELLHILDFQNRPALSIDPERAEDGELRYRAPVGEFLLSAICLQEGEPFVSARDRSVEILICTRGQAAVTDLQSGESIPLPKGTSVLVPASIDRYKLEGIGTVYKASVPVE